MRIAAKKLLTVAGWQEQKIVEVARGVVQKIEDQAGSSQAVDVRADRLVPGLFDVHIHGGNGFDASRPERKKLRVFLDQLLQSGVTDLLMTISTGIPADLRKGMAFVRQAMCDQQDGRLGGARIQGVHLEGPFLNRKRPGAMTPERILEPDVAAFEQLFGADSDLVRLVTLAPELPGAAELIAHLAGRGIAVQAGHTDASYEEAGQAFAQGVRSICHTFNASRGIHHREPGILTAALLEPSVYCEAICDFIHLHPAIVQLLYRLKGADRLMIVSDSTMPTGLPDGIYHAANHPVVVADGIKRTPDGALSGGICYLDQSMRNLLSLGIPAADAFKMGGRTPAERLGLPDLGSIRPGCPAHLAAFSDQMQVQFAIVADEIRFKAGQP